MSGTVLGKPIFCWEPSDKEGTAYTACVGTPASNPRFVGDGWLFELDVEMDGSMVTVKSAAKPMLVTR